MSAPRVLCHQLLRDDAGDPRLDTRSNIYLGKALRLGNRVKVKLCLFAR